MLGTLSCENLTLQVAGRILCPAITFAIEPGQLWAVLGSNGSGKTTLVHTLAGLQHHVSGAVRLDGAALASRTSRQRAREIGVLLQQEDGEFWGSVLEYVLLGRFAHARSWSGWLREDEDRALAALQAVELTAFAARRLVTLSGGERQRARIAQLLAQAPRIFLLDEPLQHLDLKHQARTLALFRDLACRDARAVAMVLHDALWPGRFCTHALLIHDDGNALGGPAPEVLTRGNLERLYGCRLEELAYEEGRYFVPNV
jgi:iron complex transport system ATP-binding protein